jgi:hypothetical protein
VSIELSRVGMIQLILQTTRAEETYATHNEVINVHDEKITQHDEMFKDRAIAVESLKQHLSEHERSTNWSSSQIEQS